MKDTITRRDPATGLLQHWQSDGSTGYWITIHDETEITPSRVEPMPVMQQPTAVTQHRTTESIKGDHISRAKGFEVRTRILSLAFGLASILLWFIGRWVLPKLSGEDVASFGVSLIVAVLVGLIIFVAVWAGAYVLDMLTSPGGIGLIEAWRTQRRLDRQSNAMINAFKKANGIK